MAGAGSNFDCSKTWVLQRRWDAEFSEHSYGFSAHQAVAQAQKYIAEGRRWVVDTDGERAGMTMNRRRQCRRRILPMAGAGSNFAITARRRGCWPNS
jgi:hypothetical protein